MTTLLQYLERYDTNWYVVRGRLQVKPEEASQPDRFDAFPLYRALIRRPSNYPPLRIVRALLEAYPPALWQGLAKDNTGLYCPLVAACWRRAPIEILKLLVESRPSVDRDRRLLGILWKSYTDLFGDEETLLNHITTSGLEGAEIWRKFHLLLRFCTAGSMEHWQPMHLVAANPTGCSLELLQFCFLLCPDQARERDSTGSLPLHHFCRCPAVVTHDGSKTGTGTGTTASASALPQDTSISFRGQQRKLQALIDWFPQATTTRDGGDQLPLHIAMKNQQPWAMLEQLMKANPPSIGAEHSGFLPFQLAAAADSDVSIIYNLLRDAPELVSQQPPLGVSTTSMPILPDRPETTTRKDLLEYPGKDAVKEAGLDMISSGALSKDPSVWAKFHQILSLHSAQPDHVNGKDNDNGSYGDEKDDWRVVHAAAEIRECPVGLIRLVAIFHPHELSQRDALTGSLPLHLVASHTCVRNVVHIWSQAEWEDVDEDQEQKRTDRVKTLLNAYPAAAKERDNQGRLPLHVAAEAGQPWEALDALIHASPDALSERDDRGLFPFQSAAASGNATVETVYRLLQTNPSLVTMMTAKA